MKKLVYFAVGLVLAALIIFAAGCDITSPPVQSSGAGVSNAQNTGIWVTGTGMANAVPDVAILNLGVEVQESAVAQAQGEASAAMNAIFNELKSAGVADKDIQTQQYYITPVWTYNKDTGQQTLVGYRVTNTVTVKIRKVSDTGTIIDAAARAGGNYTTIQGISFTVDNPAPYQETARKAAMADAQAKAKTLADAANVDLGAPLYINESGGAVPVKNIAVPSAGSPAPPPISPGESTITVNVQVVYSIK